MELAEWLVKWDPELASWVRCSTWSSSIMRLDFTSMKTSAVIKWLSKKMNKCKTKRRKPARTHY